MHAAEQMATRTDDLNVVAVESFPAPAEIKRLQPATDAMHRMVAGARQAVRDILRRRDPRLLVIVGPCSIHDVDAARDYAARLGTLAEELDDTLCLVMRAYFEKPRTTVGWKGLINDPDLNDTFHVQRGIRMARQLLLDIADLGLPIANEALDPITPQYLQELITWSAIGARTTESQTHRELASGISSAVGFKNGTDGSLSVAINALQSVAKPHRFLGVDAAGRVAVIATSGNPDAHIVLRGGSRGPNYHPADIAHCEKTLADAGLPGNIMVDCSHANSNKDHRRQGAVAEAVAAQIAAGNRSIIGVMIESNLHAGRQSLATPEQLAYGVSITDACIGWKETETLLRSLAERLREPLRSRHGATMQVIEGR